MKTMKILLSLFLSLWILSSCKKDYTCHCNTVHDSGYTSTSDILITDLSNKKALEFCDGLVGTYAYTDPVTGFPASYTKSCELQ